MVKNAPSNADNSGSIPGQGTKILHAWATKPVCGNYGACALWLHATTKAQGHNERACVLTTQPNKGKNKNFLK